MEGMKLWLEHNTLDATRRAYRKALEPVCLQWALTQTELDVLLFLHNNPQFDRAADVVERKGLQKSHVSLSVGNLLERGMLEKTPDPTDKRSVHLALTQKGHRAAQDGRLVQEQLSRQLVNGISESDLKCFRYTMERILKNINAINESVLKKEQSGK